MLDTVLLPAGATLQEDTGTITVSAGFLIGEQKEAIQHTGLVCEPGRNVPFKTASWGFPFPVVASRLPRGGYLC